MSATSPSGSLGTRRVFNRYELKFLVSTPIAAALTADLADWVQPDPAPNGSTYRLSSLYYDTPDLRCYWEKLDGLKIRRKLRIRRYGRGPLSLDDRVFVEIKARHDRATQKRRVPLTYGEALALCNDRELPRLLDDNTDGPVDDQDHREAALDASVLGEIHAMVTSNLLRPRAITDYQRTAFVGDDHDAGLRITFDRDLQCRVNDLDLSSDGTNPFLFPPGWVVVEVKVNERIPRWLSGAIARHALTLTRVSKYAQAIEVARLAPPSRTYLTSPEGNTP